jgi:CheY-like chemotaxis protein
MDGMEATKRIRKLPDGDKVKIVAVTASAYSEQRDEMLTTGMDDYVSKPYRAGEIYSCLAIHLGVEYIYSDSNKTVAPDKPLTHEMLDGLPHELIKELKGALESLQTDRINAAIQQVAQSNPELHKQLSYLASNFDYPVILQAMKND